MCKINVKRTHSEPSHIDLHNIVMTEFEVSQHSQSVVFADNLNAASCQCNVNLAGVSALDRVTANNFLSSIPMFLFYHSYAVIVRSYNRCTCRYS